VKTLKRTPWAKMASGGIFPDVTSLRMFLFSISLMGAFITNPWMTCQIVEDGEASA
jgi:hypothetical protein